MGDAAVLDHRALEALVPHAGRMCLLDKVRCFDAERIECLAYAADDPGNPLRCAGHLHAVHAVEYAAQAMAVHGALLQQGDAINGQGRLASVRNVRWGRRALDDRGGPLRIRCRRLGGDSSGVLFEFEVADAEGTLASGQGMIAFVAKAGPR